MGVFSDRIASAQATIESNSDNSSCTGVVVPLTRRHAADASLSSAEAEQRALGDLCHVLMNSAAFLYVD